jgi:hypothetical protein
MKKYLYCYLVLFIIVGLLESCATKSNFHGEKSFSESIFMKIQDILNRDINNEKTLTTITELKEIDKLTDDKEIKRFLYGIIAEELSFLGNYKESLLYSDKYGYGEIHNKNKSGENLDEYMPKDAVSYIESIAANNQVIFINEAHHIPMHRAFSILLLNVLYKKGFRYFAAETLNSFDKKLNNRGYPLINTSGYYSNEPIYGDLIRTALSLGYTIIPYEAEVSCKYSLPMLSETAAKRDSEHVKCQNNREYNQALNLYKRILKKDPKAKIFVHAGYGHIKKKGNDTWNPMGKNFQEITGITPYTIDQESMREHSTPDYESDTYKYIIKKHQIKHPTILLNTDSEIWVEKEYLGAYDLQIFHPRTRFIHGRPNWLLLNGVRNTYTLNNINTDGKFPYLVSAYYKNEDQFAVPIDRLILLNKNSARVLVLPKGEFTIIIKDISGNIIANYVVSN